MPILWTSLVLLLFGLLILSPFGGRERLFLQLPLSLPVGFDNVLENDILDHSNSAQPLKLSTAEESTQLVTPTSKAILFSPQYTRVTPISINGSCGSSQLREYTSESVCLMSMQLNLMAQIFLGGQSKYTEYSCKIKCAHFGKVSCHCYLNMEKAIQIRPIFISLILLDVDNGLSWCSGKSVTLLF